MKEQEDEWSEEEGEWSEEEGEWEEVCKKEKIISVDNDKIYNYWKCVNCNFHNELTKKVCIICFLPNKKIVDNIINNVKMIQCKKCLTMLEEYEFYNHNEDCNILMKKEKTINNGWYVELTENQKKSLKNIHNKAKKSSEKAKTKLLDKIKKYGFKEKDLDLLLNYIKYKIPIIIHFKDKSIPLFMKDTHYRNLFETKVGNGGSCTKMRNDAEVKLFGNIYNKLSDFERVKYGTFNFGNKKEGCIPAKNYGKSWFKLNDINIRWRVTFSNVDSFSRKCVTGTLDNCCHVLHNINERKIVELLKLVKSKSNFELFNEISYTEIQIHGPILFNRDISECHSYFTQEIDKFCNKNNIKFISL